MHSRTMTFNFEVGSDQTTMLFGFVVLPVGKIESSLDADIAVPIMLHWSKEPL